MINSRNDTFKCYSGPFFKAMENEVYKYHSFIKHVPVPDRPALICALDKSGCYKYATDFTAFESHFKKEIMEKIEFILYDHLLQDYPEDALFIKKVLGGTNKMRTRTGIRA